jgi:predicted ATP-grasp superfamily ATP-dependent carboligase
VRSLGKQGITITLATENGKNTIASFSKYVSKKIEYFPYSVSENSFIDNLIQQIQKENYDMIIPVGEGTTGLLSKYKKKLHEHTTIPVDDYSTWIQAKNKENALKLAGLLSLPCPKTCFQPIEDPDILKGIIDYPFILKPKMEYGSKGIVLIRNKNDFLQIYPEITDKYGTPLIQEYIPPGGSGYGVSILSNKGEVKAIFTHKRIREYPVNGGPSTLRISIKNEVLESCAKALIQHLHWTGLAMVEFKQDPRDNQFKLMEINPRFWGSLPHAVCSGVDFPFLLFELFSKGDIPPVLDYQIDVKSRWLLGDVLWVLGSQNRFQALSSFIKTRKISCYDILAINDPLPMLFELVSGISLMKSRKTFREKINRGIQ